MENYAKLLVNPSHGLGNWVIGQVNEINTSIHAYKHVNVDNEQNAQHLANHISKGIFLRESACILMLI